MNIYIHFRISINRSDQRDQRPQLLDYYHSDIKFCYFKIELSLTELYKYWTMNTVSSLSLNRLQSKTAKMTGLVLCRYNYWVY